HRFECASRTMMAELALIHVEWHVGPLRPIDEGKGGVPIDEAPDQPCARHTVHTGTGPRHPSPTLERATGERLSTTRVCHPGPRGRRPLEALDRIRRVLPPLGLTKVDPHDLRVPLPHTTHRSNEPFAIDGSVRLSWVCRGQHAIGFTL